MSVRACVAPLSAEKFRQSEWRQCFSTRIHSILIRELLQLWQFKHTNWVTGIIGLDTQSQITAADKQTDESANAFS